MADPRVQLVVDEVAKIPDEEFAEYGGGWPGSISWALVDAVFSIRARYEGRDGKGVLNRLKTFAELYPDAANDLQALQALGDKPLLDVMGKGTTGGRKKATCVLDAAANLSELDPPVLHAEDIDESRVKETTRAYTQVVGLGKVTAEYFHMLLGVPGVKADRMIVGFVNAALQKGGHLEVGPSEARRLVGAAYDLERRGCSLNHYDHAIWRTKGDLVEDDA